MKIGLFLIVGAFGFGFFQKGCDSGKNTIRTSANNHNLAVASSNLAPSSPAVRSASSKPTQKESTNSQPYSPDRLSWEDARPFLELQERCKHTPVSVDKVVATPLTGPAPLKVTFDGSSAYDPDGTKIIKWVWHFGNGQSSEGKKTTYIYEKPGKYGIGLNVTDSQGQKTSDCGPPSTGILITVTGSETKNDNSTKKEK